MAKKRVLICIDWFLPGDKAGGPVRSVANLVAHLGNEIEFLIVTRDTDYTSQVPYATVKSDAWNDTKYGAQVYYISEKNLNRETIGHLLRDTNYDHVYLNGIWSQPFTIWPLEILRTANPQKPVTVAARGMLAPSALAIKRLKKKAFLQYAKWKGIFSAAEFHATTENEQLEIKAVFGADAKVKVAGNLPRHSAEAPLDHSVKEHGTVKLVSIARIAPEKNTLYAIEALRHCTSKVEMNCWGAEYDSDYAALCREAIKTLPANCSVAFKGPLDTDEIQKTLAQADILFLPTRGENFGHIILESLQAGTPVLISDQTPWSNLAVSMAGWDLSLADPKEFATVIDRVSAMEEQEFSEWRRGAKLMADNYTNDKNLIELSRRLFL